MKKKMTVRLKYALTILTLAVFAFVSVGEARAANAVSWTPYTNGRFGYSVEYPDIFTNIKEPDNGDGMRFESEDENYGLIISGGYNALKENAESRLAERLAEVSHIIEGSEDLGNIWYRIVYSNDGGKGGNEHLFHEYGIINEGTWATFILSYPKKEEKRFTEIIPRMEKSLALAPSDNDSKGGERDGPDVNVFSVKDGRVFKNDQGLDFEVHFMPEDIDNGIAFWAILGTDTSDAVMEAEMGVWFFGNEGNFITFIPMENTYEYQNILWSPAGDRLILVTGSGVRPDMFFELYAPGMEKKAEFAGPRGGIQWMDDGMRVGFTRFDDGIREGGRFFNLAYGVRLSAVLYDSATDETIVLKKSTDTQNFWFSGISEDGKKIMISEEYVKSPEDWSDEEKIEKREITVPVPPAG